MQAAQRASKSVSGAVPAKGIGGAGWNLSKRLADGHVALFGEADCVSPRAQTSLCERGDVEPRQVDGEDASPIRQVAGVDATMVGFSAPSAEGEPQTQAGPIRASLLEWSEQCVTISAREPAAFVLDLDEHAIGGRTDA